MEQTTLIPLPVLCVDTTEPNTVFISPGVILVIIQTTPETFHLISLWPPLPSNLPDLNTKLILVDLTWSRLGKKKTT